MLGLVALIVVLILKVKQLTDKIKGDGRHKVDEEPALEVMYDDFALVENLYGFTDRARERGSARGLQKSD